jgi:hypothetical protein
VGYTSISNSPDGRYLVRVSDWRFTVGGGDTTLWGVGIVLPMLILSALAVFDRIATGAI